jgi:hypothetical protein
MNRGVSFVFCLASACSLAFAQVDTYKLRDKYGPPLDRETFTVRPGIEMVVDYGSGKQVCRIQLPSGIKYGGTVPADAVTKEKIEAVLEEVLPPSIRGKQINEGMGMTGAFLSFSMADYEHVTISEVKNGDIGNGITVTFKDAVCQKHQGQ